MQAIVAAFIFVAESIIFWQIPLAKVVCIV